MPHIICRWHLLAPYATLRLCLGHLPGHKGLPPLPKQPRAQRLETASARRKLPISKKPIYAKIAPNVRVGYRRNEGPGTWNVRVTGLGIDWIKRIGLADDFEPSDGRAVLDFWEAVAA